MKSTLWSVICFYLLAATRAFAEVPPGAPASESNPASEPTPLSEPPPGRTPEELEQLFGAIALYPDALIALILPASTVPSDVVLASRFLKANGDLANAEKETWDDSVKALVHYPDVINWMDQNLAWTKQAGEAFLAQPKEVMSSIQHLRFKALAAGTLVNTPQQQIVVEGDTIRIIPAQTNVIYVPVYDPAVVYVTHTDYYASPFLTFGLGWATGYWLAYDCDWGHRRIWTVDPHYREKYWHDHADWRRPNYPGRASYGDGNYHHQTWQSPRSAPTRGYARPGGDVQNYYVNDGSRNRPSGSDGHNNPPNSRSENHADRSSADNRGGHVNPRPSTPAAPTTSGFTPPQPNRVARPATPTVSPQPPRQSQPDHREHRNDDANTNGGVRSAGNSTSPAQTRPQAPQRPTQQAADRTSPPVRTHERTNAPMNSSVQPNRVASVPSTPSPAPRTTEPNYGQDRGRAPAPAPVQSTSTDQSSSSSRGERSHRADRVQSD